MIDSRVLRSALGQFATGVCVVAVRPKLGSPIGMTINSFSSVSLDPPLILWSIQNGSGCFDAFNQAEYFSINILSAHQRGVSERYARRGERELSQCEYRDSRWSGALLHGALTSFDCRVWARYPGGDHLIIVGEVMDIVGEGADEPLLFYRGGYAKLSQAS